ncbi:unnamed protein product [Rotaria sp. Silwood1]|nr:unnamed protein product [Rotaria sp. Silwood1]
MSLTTSPIMPMIVQTSRNQNNYDQVRIINPNETITYEPYVNYQTQRTTYRNYPQPSEPKYRYTIEQEDKSYRCCQWCRYWCTRQCPICNFCDRIVACPLLFFILSGLFLFLLLAALLTLFGLHPSRQNIMSLTTSTVTPLIVRPPPNETIPDYVTIINPDGSISYEPNSHYQQPTIIRRSYAKINKKNYRYALQQEGKSYRCCQWCQYWCTRNCPLCNFCDRILAFPLLCLILSALFLLLLLAALLTLFGLHSNINPSRRYYGIISILSISNRTKYVYGLDGLCNKYSGIRNCLNLTTSTAIVYVATTNIINQTVTIHNYSYVSFILLCCCLIIYYINRRIPI